MAFFPLQRDTIFALSTGWGKAAVAVFRLSGPDCLSIAQALSGQIPRPRYAHLCTFSHPQTKEFLDRGLLLFFPAPLSFTGENCLEFHIHGSLATLQAMIEALQTLGARLAEPGEFTRRAFEEGKMDLLQVEGLADLIEAETPLQRRQALDQTLGEGLSRQAEIWRKNLLYVAALLETTIDFSEEEDVPKNIWEDVQETLLSLTHSLEEALSTYHRGERIRQGVVVVLRGAPNTGKSALLNALAKRDVAIVSPYAGTTRDVLEVHLNLEGLPLILVDTAGIHETDNPVEQEGIRRAEERAQQADFLLLLTSMDQPAPDLTALLPSPVLPFYHLQTKSDLEPSYKGPGLRISTKTGEGLELLIKILIEGAQKTLRSQEPALVTRARHAESIRKAQEALSPLLQASPSSFPIEISAEYIRTAHQALASLSGRIDVEDILDDIFSRFCIGK